MLVVDSPLLIIDKGMLQILAALPYISKYYRFSLAYVPHTNHTCIIPIIDTVALDLVCYKKIEGVEVL